MAAIDPATATSRRSKARPLWARTPRSRSHPSPGLIVFPTLDKLSTRWEFAHIVDNITTLKTFKDAISIICACRNEMPSNACRERSVTGWGVLEFQGHVHCS